MDCSALTGEAGDRHKGSAGKGWQALTSWVQSLGRTRSPTPASCPLTSTHTHTHMLCHMGTHTYIYIHAYIHIINTMKFLKEIWVFVMTRRGHSLSEINQSQKGNRHYPHTHGWPQRQWHLVVLWIFSHFTCPTYLPVISLNRGHEVKHTEGQQTAKATAKPIYTTGVSTEAIGGQENSITSRDVWYVTKLNKCLVDKPATEMNSSRSCLGMVNRDLNPLPLNGQ